MYLLALESTANLAGVALVHSGKLMGAVQIAHGQNLSGNLLHATEWLLNRHGLSREAIRAVAVDVGPGAFTGLKIGVMIAKTLAHALNLDLVGVSAFEACACVMPEGTPTLVALPARRDALYVQWLLPKPIPEPLSQPAMVLQHALSAWLEQTTPAREGCQAIGSPKARGWLEPLMPALRWRMIEAPPPEGVAQVGWVRWQAGERTSPFQMVPFYLQPPSITPPGTRARTP
ncbi:tRNA threonylcarbamoyladenosine biosynthesis protein TsaB [Armatimonadetes bacterium GBS]|nr:tRNA threonylcarbamoyladenosine biosynthesis protein TsaB [Armatimonadetes bacterium GBS]